jgi:two-component system response regulator NreC
MDSDGDRTERIRVLIVDDHAIVRAGIRFLLTSTDDVEVVGEARDAAEAMRRARELNPDIILMDVKLQGISGLEATRQLQRVQPDARVLMLTMHDDEEYFFEAVNAGASGYVLKEAAPEDLLSAIRTVHQGGIAFHPLLARRLLEDYLQRVRAGDEVVGGPQLTEREREVLRLTAEGHSARQLGELLFLSPKTVERHRANLMRKLNVHNRSELIQYALRKGLLQQRR